MDDLLDVSLACDDLVKYYGGSEQLKVVLKNSNGNAFADGQIIVKINSNIHYLITNVKGEAFLDVNLNPGNYEAQIIFEETEKYHSAAINATITVYSTAEGEDVVKLYGSGTQYFAMFTDSNGKALGNTKVTFTISGKSYDITTMPNGVAKININFKPGNYVISTVNPVTGQKVSNKITIYYRIMGKDTSNYDGAKTVYKVRIYTASMKPVGAGYVVKFKVNGKIYKVKTTKYGYAKLSIKLKPNTYSVKVKFSKFVLYNTITVKKLLSAENIYKKASKKTYFQAKLVYSNGNAQKGKIITFKIDGKIYKAKTNKYGIATLTLKNLKVGKYKIISSYGTTAIKNTIKIK